MICLTCVCAYCVCGDLVLRATRLLQHMERWFIGGLIFWRPPNGEDVLSLLSIRESLLKRSGLVGGKNPKKQTSGAKKVSEEDFRDLRQRVVETLRRHADRTFSPGFDVLQQPAVRGGAPQTAAADLRDVFYHDEFSTLVSIGACVLRAFVLPFAITMKAFGWSILPRHRFVHFPVLAGMPYCCFWCPLLRICSWGFLDSQACYLQLSRCFAWPCIICSGGSEL